MAPRIDDELSQALQVHHGCVQAEGPDGKVVVMSMEVYRELMGVGSDEELVESLKAIDQAMADFGAGKSIPLKEARRRLDAKHGRSG